jgi:hypothetical protein
MQAHMLGQNFHQVFGDVDGGLAAVLGWADVHAASGGHLGLTLNVHLTTHEVDIRNLKSRSLSQTQTTERADSRPRRKR